MTEHIFLTGDIQVGKSTAINRALEILQRSIGGFRTISESQQSSVYLVDADNPIIDSNNRVADRHHSQFKHEITAYPEVFDRLGVELLQNIENKSIILMDELGFLESNAYLFQQAVFSCLDNVIPVLGVVRNRETPFLNAVRSHPNVTILYVTKENRDEIPLKIVEKLTDSTE